MKIQFYDLSTSQELAFLNGKILTFSELYDYHKTHRPLWPNPVLSRDRFCAMEFHPYGIDQCGGRPWTEYFSTAIQLISGHLPSKEEMKNVREYIRRLPNDFKRNHVDKRFVLSFVTYLFTGFKSHVFEVFRSESNPISMLCQFTLALHSSQRVLFSSFLCAHRDPKINETLNLLQSRIPPEKIRRAASLVLALAHNVHEGTYGNAIFLQQKMSQFASSSIFPEVTVEYLENGRAYEMLNQLDTQYRMVNEAIRGLVGERIQPRLVTLDILTFRIERFLRERFGLDWRTIDFASIKYEQDPIVQIGVEMVLPGIKRMMPFFSEDFQQSFIARKMQILELNRTAAYSIGGKQLVDLVTGMVEWFMSQHSMTISAKAVYEATFYYLWGKYCGKFGKAFAIGFDREHDIYQHFAWGMGAESERKEGVIQQSFPLYARRNPSGHERGALVDLSFRQFWRY